MRSDFTSGFEKTAVVGAVLAGGARVLGGALARGAAGVGRVAGGAARLAGKAVRGGANLFTRAQTGNLTRPLSAVDKGFGALGALGIASDYGDNVNKLRNASMR